LNRSRGWMFALVLAGLLAVTGGAWLLLGRQTGAEASNGPAAPASEADEAIVLPEARSASAEALEVAAGGIAPPAPDAAAAAEEAVRTLAGRVLMEDRGALPQGLSVFAAKERPVPTLFSMGDMVSDSSRQRGLREDFGGDAAPDGRGALVPVAADGRFELPASASQEWIGVTGSAVYVDPPVRVAAGEEREVELLLVRGAVLEGQLQDSSGAPLAGRRVQGSTPFDPYAILDSASRMASLGSVCTDAQGRFVFPQVPAGLALQLVGRNTAGPGAAALAEGPAMQSARTTVKPLAVGERRAITLVLRPAGAVSGRVLRADETPVPAVKVALQRSSVSLGDLGVMGDDKGNEAVTDEEGRFLFPRVSDGSYEAVLTHIGFRVTHSEPLTIRDGSPVKDVRLLADTGLTLSGRVLDEDGQPIAEVRLRGYPPPGMMSFGGAFDRELRPQVSSHEDGSFEIEGLEAGKVRVDADAPGFHGASVDAKAGDTGVELRLGRLTTLAGIVVSLTDGEPVRNFSLVLEPAEGLFDAKTMFGGGGGAEQAFGRIVRDRFTSREDGTFSVNRVVPGSYDAIFSANGFGLHTEPALEIPREGRRGVVVMLEPEAAAFGVLVDSRSGEPVSGAVVRTSAGNSMSDLMNGMVRPAAKARSDSAGRFRLGELSAGAVSLVVEHPQYMRLGLTELVLAAGEQHDLGTLRLSKGGAVFGTVYDAIGSVPDVGMMVSNAMGSVVKRTTTDASGRYRIEGLPAGTYNVMRMDFNMSTGGNSSPSDILKDLVYEQVTLVENEEQRVDLHVRSDGTKLTGRVTDAAGPVPGAVLTLMPESPGAKLGVGSSDAEGRYEIGRVATGRYELSVTTVDGLGPAQGSMGSNLVATLDLGAQAEAHHDVVLPGGVLNGVVLSKKDGHAVGDVRVVLLRTDSDLGSSSLLKALGGRVGETYSGADGGFRFRHIPGGSYSVIAGGKGMLGLGASGWSAKRVDGLSVLEGKPGFTVKVEVEPAAVVAGTLSSSSGQPLAGVGVWVLDAAGTPRSIFSEVISDSGGAYEVGDLQPGLWTLAFMDGGHALTLVRGVQVNAEQRVPLDVRLPEGVPLRLNLAGRPGGSIDVGVSGPDGPMPTRLITPNDLANLPAGAGQLPVGTFAPGNYQVRVMAAGVPLLEDVVTLATGAGPKIVELPKP
jgi:hypothetical protein